MRLYFQMMKLLFNKFILRKSNGEVIKRFSEKMGIVYIKLAQILATQNYGNLFTEEDRQMLSSICDDCNPIKYSEIEKMLKQEYGDNLANIFSFIERTPIGSASVSQVHRAILTTGEEVAVKIKRKDITKTIDRDIKRIRKLMHRFGKFVSFKNFIGGDHALDLYLGWIRQETDFIQERENIKTYTKFANNVNGKIAGTKLVKIPKLYEDFCTDNIIIMEFIKIPTINKMQLTEENKEKIRLATNSYIKLSLWAILNDETVVFHGDPHSGNVCVDDYGNICFLDMGLLCSLSANETKLCRKFFLTAFSGNYEKLSDMLSSYGNMTMDQKNAFREDCRKYCSKIKEENITCLFTDMINVCLNYELVPPNFLYNMAKPFVCLNGISNFSDNKCSTIELMQEQIMEFLIKRSLNDCRSVIYDGLNITPKAVVDVLKYGLVNGMIKATANNEIRTDIQRSLENLKETLNIVKSIYSEEPFS